MSRPRFASSDPQRQLVKTLAAYGISRPRYVDVTERRWDPLTYHTATLDGDSRSFAEMARVRHPALDREGRAQ